MINYWKEGNIYETKTSDYIGTIPSIELLDKEFFRHFSEQKWNELIEYWTKKGEFTLALTYAKIKLHLDIDRATEFSKRIQEVIRYYKCGISLLDVGLSVQVRKPDYNYLLLLNQAS